VGKTFAGVTLASDEASYVPGATLQSMAGRPVAEDPVMSDPCAPLKIQHEEGVDWMLFNRPPVNALTLAVIKALIAALGHSAQDPRTRVVVLGGKGPHFCAGVDLREQADAWRNGRTGAAEMGESLYRALLDFPKPLICMAHGAVAGAGLSILCCCDLAIAAEGTRVSLPEINVGVLGGVSHLRTVVSRSLAHYLALTGQPIDAARLRGTGLFLDIVPADELQQSVAVIARNIAAKHPEAARYTKRCMRAVEGVGQLDGYLREQALSQELRASGVTDVLVTRFLGR